MSVIFATVLSVLTYWNILTLTQVGKELDSLSKYVQKFANKESVNIDFERLQRANVLIINGVAAGSGTVISMEDGYIYILTARHIAESMEETYVLEIEVPMINKNYKDTNTRHMNRTGCQYVVVNKSKDVVICEDYDMALIRIKDFSGHDLAWIPPAKKDLKIGATIYTVGNPACNIDIIARGLYNGIDLRDGVEAVLIYGGITYGNSGGALVNEDGEILGVVFAKCIPYPVSHVGVCTTRKQTITFVNEAFEILEKENRLTESNKNFN
jgi:S1-C subfamily serine protease